jgi:hypothetical protein
VSVLKPEDLGVSPADPDFRAWLVFQILEHGGMHGMCAQCGIVDCPDKVEALAEFGR